MGHKKNVEMASKRFGRSENRNDIISFNQAKDHTTHQQAALARQYGGALEQEIPRRLPTTLPWATTTVHHQSRAC